MVPLETVLYLQSNQSSVTESLALSMGLCSKKSCHCVGARLSSRLTNLWASEPAAAACGHVHWVLEVHSMKYFAWEMHVHVLALPAWLLLSSCCVFRVFGGPERGGQFWIFALAMYCLLSFLYVTQYLEYIRWTFGCPHFAEMRHIFSFHNHVLGVIGKKYTHPECCTMTE